MITKVELQAIERARSNLNRHLCLIGANRHFDEALDEALREEKDMRRWGKSLGRKFSRGYSASVAAHYWAIKPMLELVTGYRTLPDLGDTLDMPRRTVIACQLFARYEKSVRNAFADLSPEHKAALLNFDHTTMSEEAA